MVRKSRLSNYLYTKNMTFPGHKFFVFCSFIKNHQLFPHLIQEHKFAIHNVLSILSVKVIDFHMPRSCRRNANIYEYICFMYVHTYFLELYQSILQDFQLKLKKNYIMLTCVLKGTHCILH